MVWKGKTSSMRRSCGTLWSRGEWATTAEDPTGYHLSPLQIGKRGYNLQELTKIGSWRLEKCCPVWSDESRFLLRHSVRIWRKQNENMDPSCLVTTVQGGGGGVMVLGMFSWLTLGLFLPTFLKNDFLKNTFFYYKSKQLMQIKWNQT